MYNVIFLCMKITDSVRIIYIYIYIYKTTTLLEKYTFGVYNNHLHSGGPLDSHILEVVKV